MEAILVTRKDLYDLVWSKPLTLLAKEYEIKYSDIRNVCTKNKIPLPENGFWSKLKFNKHVKRVDLPVDSEINAETIVSIKKEGKRNTDLIKKLVETESTINQPKKLTKPDVLIVRAKENLQGKKTSFRDDLVHTDVNQLNIAVSPKNIQRALRFADMVIKLLKTLDIEVKIENSNNIAVVLGEEIAFSFQEKIAYRNTIGKYGWNERESISTDVLTFRYWLASERSYIDKKIISDGAEPLEKKLEQIITGLESMAQKEIENRQERERYWAEQKEKQRIEAERIKKEREDIRKQKQDEENFETLLNQAQRWQKSKILREYLNEIETQAKKHGELTPELTEWLNWARKKTKKFDPLAY